MTDSPRVLELKSALKERLDLIEEGTQKGVKVEGSNVEMSPETYATMKKAHKEALEIKELIDIEQFGVSTKAWMDAPAGPSSAVQAALGAMAPQYKTLGELFVKSDLFQEFKGSRRATMPEAFVLEAGDVPGMGTFDKKDVYAALAEGTITRGIGTRVQFDPLVPRAQRTNRVRDLFPVATTSANLIDFFRVLGFVSGGDSGNASMVPDRDVDDDENPVFGRKPKSDLSFESAQAPVRTIAHWEAAHRNVLQDEPQLQSTINNELLYGLALEEDYQILQGTGTGEDLLGILNTTGVQPYNAPNGEIKSDSLRRAATKAIIANYAPTGYVIHPNDWEDVELQKGETNDHYMLVTNIGIGMSAQVWRQPVVETVAMPEGTFLTGAFGIAAQLYDRQQANVRIAEQHEDFFVRNALVILVEERLALATKRPEAFVKGTFDS